MAMKPCLTCGALTSAGSYCQRHQPRNGSARQWRHTRAHVLIANPICAEPGCNEPAEHVDHITPVIDGGTDDPSNLQPLCAPPQPRERRPMTMTDAERDQMQHLFEQAMDTGPTTAALDRLIYCHLVNRITDGNVDVALETFSDPGTAEAANRELESLNDDERTALARAVIPTWNRALSLAVIHMWTTCRTLGYDPDGLGADHLAIVASMFLGADFEHLGAWPVSK